MSERRASRLLDWKGVLGIAISVAALYYVFHDKDFGLLLAEVKAADPLYFFLATFCATFVFWIRAWRWKALLDPVRQNTTFHSRFAATTIGFMGNNVFPARLGEFMRVIALARAERIPVVSCATSIVLERMLDAFTVIGMLFLALALPGLPALAGSEGVAGKARLVGFVMSALLLVLVTFIAWPERAVRIAEKIVSPLPLKVRRLFIDALEAFLRGASALRDPRLLLRAGFWSIILWLVNGLGFWLAMRAFDLQYSFTAALFFQGWLVIAVSVPAAPGFFGTYELAAQSVLVGMWGANATTSAAFAGAYHIAGYIPVTVIGLYYAWRLRISLAEAAQSEEIVEEAVEVATGVKP